MTYEHEHKFFIYETKMAFEPFVLNLPPMDDKEYIKFWQAVSAALPANLYERVEYVVLGCSCGNVIRKRMVTEGV
jgi:hypothetical protein